MPKPLIILAAVLLAAVPLTALAGDAPERYRLDLRVTEQGRDVAATETFIAEDQAVSLNLSASGEQLTFDAVLYAVQGDGDAGLLSIEASVVMNGQELAAPRMTFRRGGQAAVDVGAEGGDGVRITIAPAD